MGALVNVCSCDEAPANPRPYPSRWSSSATAERNTRKSVCSDAVVIGHARYARGFAAKDIYQLSEIGTINLDGRPLASWSKRLHTHFGPVSPKVSTEDEQLILRATLLGHICIVHDRFRACRKTAGGIPYALVNFNLRPEDYGRQHTIFAISPFFAAFT